MSPDQLTAEQRETIRELQEELASLDLKADIEWAKYMHTGDLDCYNEVMRLESEMEMKGLIAYIPKAGERKIDKIRGLVTKVKRLGGEECEDCDLGENEVRLSSLESVNAWRESYQLPPLERLPRGVPGDSSECTLARAFRVSLEDMGLKAIEVKVSDGYSIVLSGEGEDGDFSDTPSLGDSGSKLIERFDSAAWLDLLDDDALGGYADAILEEGTDASCDYPNIDQKVRRLQEISDEMAYRERAYPVEGEVYDEDEGNYLGVTLTLGLNARPVHEQWKEQRRLTSA